MSVAIHEIHGHLVKVDNDLYSHLLLLSIYIHVHFLQTCMSDNCVHMKFICIFNYLHEEYIIDIL